MPGNLKEEGLPAAKAQDELALLGRKNFLEAGQVSVHERGGIRLPWLRFRVRDAPRTARRGLTVCNRVDLGQFLACLLDGTILLQPQPQQMNYKAIVGGENVLLAQVQQAGGQVCFGKADALFLQVFRHGAIVCLVQLRQRGETPLLDIRGFVPDEFQVDSSAFDYIVENGVHVLLFNRALFRLLTTGKEFVAGELCEIRMPGGDPDRVAWASELIHVLLTRGKRGIYKRRGVWFQHLRKEQEFPWGRGGDVGEG